MRNIVLGALSMIALSAGAAAAATSVQIPLSGELQRACDISAFLNGPFDALDLSVTTTQGSESVTVHCNYGGTASVEFASANNGELKSGSNRVGYKLLVSGGLLDAQLVTPQTVANWPAVANADQSRSLSVQLLSAATIAGTYTDTVTASVTPN